MRRACIQLTHYLRFGLPTLFLANSLTLTVIGEAQRNRVIEYVHGQAAHGVPDSAAVARFIDYALNAPAWAAAWTVPRVIENFPSVGFIRAESHLTYFFFLVAMWYGIGVLLEKKLSSRTSRPNGDLYFIVPLLSGSYGAFICNVGNEWDYWYDPWFTDAVFAWGLGLMVISSVVLIGRVVKPTTQFKGSRARWIRRVVASVCAVVLGIASVLIGFVFVRRSMSVPPEWFYGARIKTFALIQAVSLFFWGAVLLSAAASHLRRKDSC